jgi:RNA polymerase sigma-70 factor, ECF subfamily
LVLVAGEGKPGGYAGGAQTSADHEDDLLVARAAARDEAAFRVLVDKHLPALMAVGRRLLGDAAEAEDVAQEAFLRLWRGGADDLRGESAALWLRRVTRNLCLDRLRVAKRLDVTDDLPETPALATQLLELEQRELGQRVQASIDGLADRQRIALTMFHYDGATMAEIAATLGITDRAVESLLSRARRTMKAQLAAEWQALQDDRGEAV